MPPRDPLRAMETLLGAEREALMAGDLARLPELIAAKERLLPTLETGGVTGGATAAERLRRRAEANQALIAAALGGLRMARARIETARAGGPALSTYDAQGRAGENGAPRPSLTRRI